MEADVAVAGAAAAVVVAGAAAAEYFHIWFVHFVYLL